MSTALFTDHEGDEFRISSLAGTAESSQGEAVLHVNDLGVYASRSDLEDLRSRITEILDEVEPEPDLADGYFTAEFTSEFGSVRISTDPETALALFGDSFRPTF